MVYVTLCPDLRLSVYELGAQLLTPLLVHGQSEPPAMATHEQGKRGKPERSQSHRNKQSKQQRTKTTKVARAMQVAPARTLAEGSLSSPGKILAGDDSAPRQGPCRATRQGPRQGRQQGHCHDRTNQVSGRSHAAASSTSWAGTCVATCSSQANSSSTCVAARSS